MQEEWSQMTILFVPKRPNKSTHEDEDELDNSS